MESESVARKAIYLAAKNCKAGEMSSSAIVAGEDAVKNFVRGDFVSAIRRSYHSLRYSLGEGNRNTVQVKAWLVRHS